MTTLIIIKKFSVKWSSSPLNRVQLHTFYCPIFQWKRCNTIIELNSTKTEILDTYNTKDKIFKKYKISKKTLIDIIEDNKLFDDKYFIEYHKYPQDLINKYDKPINRLLHKNAKQIKQIHPISKDVIIFNTFNEIHNKFGICSTTIKNAIDTKTVYHGYLWEYVKKIE